MGTAKVRTTRQKSTAKTTSKVTKQALKNKLPQKPSLSNRGTLDTKPELVVGNTDNNVLNGVQPAVNALLQLNEKVSDKKKGLFDEGRAIFLQVVCMKIPKCPTRYVRFMLKHSLVSKLSDICLFVPDLKRGRRIDHEPTVEFYENLFRDKNIDFIKSVIPMRQLKVEYDQFELKRRLLGSYECFLADSRISGHLSHLLGKKFIDKRKSPIPVRMTNPKTIANELQKALLKTSMWLHGHGDTHVVQVGHTQMKLNEITSNVELVIQQLDKLYPGGLKNVKKMLLKTEKSLAIPFYVSTESPNNVEIPIITPKRPRCYAPVVDEISTLPGRTVTVFPDGAVTVEGGPPRPQIGSKSNKQRGKLNKGVKKVRGNNFVRKTRQQSRVENREIVKENKFTKKAKVTKDDDSSGDEFTETVENQYLTNLRERKILRKKQ